MKSEGCGWVRQSVSTIQGRASFLKEERERAEEGVCLCSVSGGRRREKRDGEKEIKKREWEDMREGVFL